MCADFRISFGMTKDELIEHFKKSTAVPDELWQDDNYDLAAKVVYSLLPLNHDPITEYDRLIKGKTAIAFGFSNNEKHFLQRHIKKYGGKFRFIKNDKEDFFIVHSTTWIYDMLYALREARKNGAIIVDFDDFSNTVGEHFSDKLEQERKIKKREEEAKRHKNGPIYKACSNEYLASLPKVPVTDISLYDDVFYIIGNTEKALRDAFENVLNSPGSHRISDFPYIGEYYKRNNIYDLIEKKGGRYVKKEESPNITCVIYGKEPSDRAIKYFERKAKLVSAVDAVNWLKEQEAISKEARIFAEKYKSSVDARLRYYQQTLKNRVFVLWRQHFNVMLQLPTGTGKTVLFTSIIHDLVAVKNTKIVILAHRKELIDQISEHLSRYNIDHGVIASGRKRTLEKSVQVASVQTLTHDKNIEILEELKPNFIIIDEAHHSLADSYTKFWKHCGKCWKLGVTATPYRLNNRSFRSHFDKLVESASIDDFINQGYLARYDFLVDNPQSSLSQTIKAIKEKSSTGDYKTATLLKELNVEQHIQRLIVCYEQYVKGKKGIVYAINKEHANRICQAYRAIGVNAIYIDSDTPKRERSETVERFSNSEIQIMVNVDIFSEGFDCPDVEFIQLARPTWSLAKYLQQVGRGMRPCDGKQKTVILDNSRMFIKFGLPSDCRLWSWHFNGDPYAKNMYKQENEEKEAELMLVCKYTNEMMVKMSKESIEVATKLKKDEEEREAARIRANEEAIRKAREEEYRQLQEAERRFAEAKAEEERKRKEREEKARIELIAKEERKRKKQEEDKVPIYLIDQPSKTNSNQQVESNSNSYAQDTNNNNETRTNTHREIEIRRRMRRELRERQQREYEERILREQQEAEEYEKKEQRNKIFAAIGAIAITLLMIHFFGLLGPAVFGLIVGGLLKR